MSDSPRAVVIEDQVDLRELTEAMLVRCGFDVVTAGDGPAGVQAVRDHDPILTTLDVNMPGMDGYEVAKQLREFSKTYLIMVTGMAEERDIARGIDAGADDYLVKPFTPRDLRAKADAAFGRRVTSSD